MQSDILDSIALRRGALRKGPGGSLAFARELGEDDREELLSPTPGLTPQGSVNAAQGSTTVRLRYTHHLLAQALAAGATHARASMLTGYRITTIHQLSLDPAFRELIEHYKTATMAEFQEIKDRAAALGLSFLDELQHRLEESPEQFTNKELRDSAAMLMDRTVLPSKIDPMASRGAVERPFMQIQFIDTRPVPDAERGQIIDMEMPASRILENKT